jgi:hypothetical protein
LYLYDFGDSWEHKITVSQVIPFNEDEAAPLCLGGKYACPLEDSGGVWGYAEILEILKDPRRKEYADIHEWAGDVDPLAFDVEEVNRSLQSTFKSAKTAAGSPAKEGSKKSSQEASKIAGPPAKGGSKESSPEASKIAGKKGGSSGGKELPDGKLKKLYALMNRVKELKPWEKLWDTDLVLIESPDQKEPALCSVMGREEQSFGLVVYPGFASMLSLLRMLDSETVNPLVFLGYQNCLLCNLGQRDELFPEERAHLKELGISFRGKHDWVYFRKARPGYSPWYIDSKDADTLIDILTRFIDAYTAFAGGLEVDFEANQVIRHRYSKEDGKWITEAGKVPTIPMTVEHFTVDSNDVEPLRFKKQKKIVIEVETLFFPQALGVNDEGIPILIRANIIADSKKGVILDQYFLKAGEDENNTMIDMLFHFINDHGRPETIMVRDGFTVNVLEDFCAKIGVNLVHSRGMPAIDNFAKDLPSLLSPLAFPGAK